MSRDGDNRLSFRPPATPAMVEGLRKALDDALRRIDALEDEVARLKGEKPLNERTREGR